MMNAPKIDIEKTPNLANINGHNFSSSTNALFTVSDPLRGQKVVTPISVEIEQFIKDEFVKLKSH